MFRVLHKTVYVIWSEYVSRCKLFRKANYILRNLLRFSCAYLSHLNRLKCMDLEAKSKVNGSPVSKDVLQEYIF